MTRSIMTASLLWVSLLGMGHVDMVNAATECIPTEQEDFIDVPVDGGQPGQMSTDSECADPEGNRGGLLPTQTVVATLPAGASQGNEWFAIDSQRLSGAASAPRWIALAVATTADAPPQVIEIGVQRAGPAGFVIVTRDSTGRMATARSALPIVSGRYLLAGATKALQEGRSMLRIGGARSDSVAWTVPATAAITLVTLVPHGDEAALIPLGQLD